MTDADGVGIDRLGVRRAGVALRILRADPEAFFDLKAISRTARVRCAMPGNLGQWRRALKWLALEGDVEETPGREMAAAGMLAVPVGVGLDRRCSYWRLGEQALARAIR